MTKTTKECLQVGDGAVQEDGEDIGDEVVFEAGTGIVVVDARRREAMQPPGLVQGPGHTSIPPARQIPSTSLEHKLTRSSHHSTRRVWQDAPESDPVVLVHGLLLEGHDRGHRVVGEGAEPPGLPRNQHLRRAL